MQTRITNTLKQHCKFIPQIKQTHAQAITTGFQTTQTLTQILHTLTLSITKNPQNTNLQKYPINLFNLISTPTTFNYNSIIRIHTNLSMPNTALYFYVEMRRKAIVPDFYTYPFVLKGLQNEILVVRMVHSELVKLGFSINLFVCNALACCYFKNSDVAGACKVFDECSVRDIVSYNVMVDGFVKVGEIDRARKVFDEMPQRDAVSWGTLLAGYAKWERCVEAVELFDCMVGLKVEFDNVAVVSVISACAQLGELEKGKEIVRDHVERSRRGLDVYLGTALVDLYAKCGDVEMAKDVFESCGDKKVSLWNAMLVGLAMHGHGPLVLQYFSRMVDSGVQPDGVTILGVLVGCSHSGHIHEAIRIFTEMESVYDVKRERKHYGCMVDLLGRAGLINEALKVIQEMPMRGDVFVWGGLLGGCKTHGNVEVAEEAAKRVMEVKPEDGGVYSELVQMYADNERWDDIVKVRKLRDCRWGIKKSAGCSLIELQGFKHEFVSGDSLHPCTEEIYFVLNGLELQQCEAI